jgi:putative transposase
MASARRKFTPHQKAQIMQQVQELGVIRVLKEHHLSYSVYARWKQQMVDKQSPHHGDTALVYEERALLQQENSRLKKIIADQALEMERKDEELKKMNPLYGKR